MRLIAIIIIGVLVLSGVGALATIPPAGTSVQSGEPSIFTFNIPATAAHGAGTLVINLVEHRFVYDGTGEPGVTYYLQYTLKNLPGVHTFASATASPLGSLHVEGIWLKKFGAWASQLANVRSTRALGFAGTTTSGNESEMLATEPTFNVAPVVNIVLTLKGTYAPYFVTNPYPRPDEWKWNLHAVLSWTTPPSGVLVKQAGTTLYGTLSTGGNSWLGAQSETPPAGVGLTSPFDYGDGVSSGCYGGSKMCPDPFLGPPFTATSTILDSRNNTYTATATLVPA